MKDRGEITIRRAQREDLPAVIALDHAVTNARKAAYWEGVFERYGRRRPEERFFLVAESAEAQRQLLGLIVGEVRAWEFGSPRCGWVFAIHVHPDDRQRRIGTRLLRVLNGLFREAGVTTVRAMLSHDNHLLMSFFRSQGMMGGPHVQLEMALPPEKEAST